MDPGAQPAISDVDATDGELTKQVCCVKYSLMACNAFGIMLGIFVVLFGISYPDVGFPGGYKGKETAGISGFFIMFTLIGYYGAHRQKIYFLVPYSVIIFAFLGGNLVMWGIKPEKSVLQPDSKAVLILGGMYLVLMAFALWLAYQERKKRTYGNVQVTSTAGTAMPLLPSVVPHSLPPHLRPVPQYATTGLMAASGYPIPYACQQPVNNALQNKKSWDIDSPLPLNVLYQPATNSYITLPASRYGSTASGPQLMY